MSFSFQWPRFSEQFHADAIQLLDAALNKGNKPPVIADRIEVVELEMGTQPPELEIRDIGELTLNQFRGIFRLTYSGDAHIVLRTKVQANPLYHKKPDIHLMGGSKGMVAANQPLVVPMLLRLSNFKLNSYVVLVVSKPKGITLVFKTDPLQNVDIHSTFDSITVIQKFIQKEIEGQLRQMFREDLPSIIHRLSQQWVKRSTTIETPYLTKQPILDEHVAYETMSNPDMPRPRFMAVPGLRPALIRQTSLRTPLLNRRRPSSSRPLSNRPSIASLRVSTDVLEHQYDFDADSLSGDEPVRRAFSHLGQIHRESKGLADLVEEETDTEDLDEDGSFDVVDWDDTMTEIEARPVSESGVTEYETIPAVGGGVITRPRVYHASSLLRTNSGNLGDTFRANPAAGPSRPSLSTSSIRHSSIMGYRDSRTASSRRESWSSSPNADSFPITPFDVNEAELNEHDFPHPATQLKHLSQHESEGARSGSSSNLSSNAAQIDSHSSSTFERRSRRDSLSSQITPSLAAYADGEPDSQPKIVLRPGINNAISQLSLLNRSNHTLSPYTRALDHFRFRSVPPKPIAGAGAPVEKQPVKAKRKRIYRLGGTTKAVVDNQPTTEEPPSEPPRSPVSAASDFDSSEVNRYFRSHDDYPPHHHDISMSYPANE